MAGLRPEARSALPLTALTRVEWTWDPDPSDDWLLTEYAFLLRDPEGTVQVVHETHRRGLFGREVWLRLLTETGFGPEAVTERTSEDRPPRTLFLAHRPPVSRGSR